MSKEQAEKFVEKTYNDDEFALQVLRAGDFKPGGKDDEDTAGRGMENFVKAGQALGYDFTDAEIEAATKAYFESLGTWKSLKKFMHFARLNRKVQR